MRIDSHQHFWHYDPSEHVWMTDAMGSLKRDFLPADLEPLLEKNGLGGTVAVQARQSLEETEWLLDLADRHEFIKGVVGWVDLRSPTVDAVLEQLAAHPKLKGIRHVVHDEADDRFMMQPAFLDGIGLLAEFDLVYDLLLFPRHLPVAVDVVGRFPKVRFVLDHLAKPDIKNADFGEWQRGVDQLGRFRNVWCKLSGMVTEADWTGWTQEDMVPAMEGVFNAFGSERIMFGSDWPVCTLAARYDEVLRIVTGYIESLPAERQESILGLCAARVYRID